MAMTPKVANSLPMLLLAAGLLALPPTGVMAQALGAGTGNVAAVSDPRQGDIDYERSQRLLSSIGELLREAAEIRQDAQKLPSRNEFSIVTPPWVETREDRRAKISALLDSALEIVTDVPVVEKQTRLAELRQNIKKIEDHIAELREKQLDAPQSGLMPGVITTTVASIDAQIGDDRQRIEANKREIEAIKKEIAAALAKSGVEIRDEQLDILLGSVIGGDIVKLVATFEAVRAIDTRLGLLMDQNGENLTAARRYFALHASLFALLVHAQEMLLEKIDITYLPRLDAIIGGIREARKVTNELLRVNNRTDQRNTLLNNLKSQSFSEEAAKTYQSYLLSQRDQLSAARQRAIKDLRIADNTYQTVEASFQLRALIKDASSSFEAIRKLEAPGFEKVFRNDELKKEFENLTQKLAPTS